VVLCKDFISSSPRRGGMDFEGVSFQGGDPSRSVRCYLDGVDARAVLSASASTFNFKILKSVRFKAES
jgi:hypothetical protein